MSTAGWIPVNDPPPPDDFRHWVKPPNPPCADCPCCTAQLCRTAHDRGTACAALVTAGPSTGTMDVTACPCTATASPLHASHPDDRESGHAETCGRHTAAVAAWRREHEAPADQPGEEVTDQPSDTPLARLQAALAAAEYGHAHGDSGQWTVNLMDPAELVQWLDMVDAVTAATTEPAASAAASTVLRLWTSQMDDRDPPEAQPLIYAELVSTDPDRAGLSHLQVFCMLDLPSEDAARTAHPQLRQPRADLEVDRATWMRYVQRAQGAAHAEFAHADAVNDAFIRSTARAPRTAP